MGEIALLKLLLLSLLLLFLSCRRLHRYITSTCFVLGLSWVALAAFHHARTMQDKMRVLEDKLERLAARAEALEDDRRARRSLPPL